ncbi:MAG: hypothetical protein U0640_03135 [Phycisphaerales bacterium]
MSERHPRLSLHSAEWPPALVAQREQLGRTAMRRRWKTLLVVGLATGLAFGIATSFTLKASNVIRFLIHATCGMASMFILQALLRHQTRDDVARLLISNGYCVCGYPYQVSGIIRSCPECGRQWTEKSLPKD